MFSWIKNDWICCNPLIAIRLDKKLEKIAWTTYKELIFVQNTQFHQRLPISILATKCCALIAVKLYLIMILGLRF